jgi:anti-sigma B factor antagonist
MAALEGERAAEVVIDASVDAAGTPIVSLSGELDSSNAGSLEAAVASITAQHPERLIFDLSGLRFMDSAGIAVLIRAAANVNAIHLRDPSPIVRRLIEVTGLSGVLPIET